jgi:hypothetical protein
MTMTRMAPILHPAGSTPAARGCHAYAVGADDDEQVDALRRRLYAPGVTEDDVAAYRAAQPEPVTEEPPDEPSPPQQRGRAAVAVGAVLVVAAVVGALLAVRSPQVAIPTRSVAVPTATPVAQYPVPASAAQRLRFVDALQSGDRAGILPYLMAHPDDLPPMLRTTQRAASDEFSGQGSSAIGLEPSALAAEQGRITVLLVPARAPTYSWQAERIAEENDRSGPVLTVASHAGSAAAGQPVSVTVPYDDGAPKRLSLYLDETVKWGVAVVFTD